MGIQERNGLNFLCNAILALLKKTVEKLTKSRSLVIKTHIQNWFDNVQSYLSENNLSDTLENPSRIFHTDESVFMLRS